MHPFINIATIAARKAGDIIVQSLDRLDTVKIYEKSTNDFVTDIDKAAEQEIIYQIRKAYPDHGILAEESGLEHKDEFLWIIDPLDGTRNFMQGFPHFCVSIAVKEKNHIEHAVIYDPIRQELFTASRGRGATLNQKKLRVSQTSHIHESLIATGLPFRSSELEKRKAMQMFSDVQPHCSDLRRAGSAALDLAYVAAGRLDAYWEGQLAIWDIAAGALLVKEAGGLVCDFEGTDNYLDNGNVLAGNPKIFKALLKLIHNGQHSSS